MKLKNQQGITTFWGISIILIESVIVFFIFYILYFFWIENPTPTSNILIVRAVTKRGITIPKTVNSASWLKYTNSNHGISLKYPIGYVVSDDSIAYGDYEGKVINFEKDGAGDFSIRFFTVADEESIDEAFERLTGVNPSIYQSFTEEVDDHDAVVYRQQPGETTGDRIYFIGNSNFFELEFNETTAQILTTFQFTN